MKLLNFGSDNLLYELQCGSKEGEYQVDFRQHAITMFVDKDGFYKQLARSKDLVLDMKTKFEKSKMAKKMTFKVYMESDEGKKEQMRLIPEYSYREPYSIVNGAIDLHKQVLSEVESFNIKDEVEIKSSNIEIV